MTLVVAYPPLSCRTSPPQGGRLDRRARSIPLEDTAYRTARSHLGLRLTRLPISPLEGEMSGRTEGGEPHAPTFKDKTP
ncbi:Hypothetical protein NGAL_HAMBI2427_28260 [Neorhizobium galegae bv. orientalis]|nr:Hypothetical protein NGAL_HAMBI2427_28260 [Neorhizobium galegae bv. orientalis]